MAATLAPAEQDHNGLEGARAGPIGSRSGLSVRFPLRVQIVGIGRETPNEVERLGRITDLG